MKKNFLVALVAVAALAALRPDAAVACTGITLTSRDSACVLARTIEWGGSELNSRYVVVPRGYRQASLLPGGAAGGMDFEAKYGYVGLAVELKEFVVEGLNEGFRPGSSTFPATGAMRLTTPRSGNPRFPISSWFPICWVRVPRWRK